MIRKGGVFTDPQGVTYEVEISDEGVTLHQKTGRVTITPGVLSQINAAFSPEQPTSQH